MKKFLLGAAAAAAMSLGATTLAHAEVFYLTLADSAAGLSGSPYGEVDVLGEGTKSMDITVSLYGTNEFHWTNDANHHALAFDLVGNPTISFSGLPAAFSAVSPQSAGADSATPFGTFDYDVNFPKLGGRPPPKMPVIHAFSFTVTSTSNLTLEPTHSSTYGDVFFATDILQANGATGNVGALRTPSVIPQGGVPEPASWALMLMGFGGMGGLIRRARRQSAAAATA